MTVLRVIGIGSPFGDDRLGWQAIDLLKKCTRLRMYSDMQLQLLCCDRPGLSLLEKMRDADTVFLIDAIYSDASPGTYYCLENEAIMGIKTLMHSTHAFGVTEAMKLGKSLNILPKKVVLYGLAVGEILNHTDISLPVLEAIDGLVIQLEQAILRLLGSS